MDNTNTNESLQLVAIRKAVRILESVGAKFHVQYGDVTFGQPVKPERTRILRRAPGTIQAIYLPHVQDMEAGDVAKFAVPEDYTLEEVRGPLSAWASITWGKGNQLSRIVKDEHAIEIMRLG